MHDEFVHKKTPWDTFKVRKRKMFFSDFMMFIKYLHPPVRCPSAPPYEAEAFSPGDIQTASSSSSEDQKHREDLTPPSNNQWTDVQRSDVQRTDVQWTDIQRSEAGSEQSSQKDGAPQLGESSRLYPSLSLWRTTADSQVR